MRSRLPSPSRPRKLGRLLLVLPQLPLGAGGHGRGPAHRLLRVLAQDWDLGLVLAGPSAPETAYLEALGKGTEIFPDCARAELLSKIKAAVGVEEYAAILVVDSPAIRADMDAIRAFSLKPLVHVLLDRPSPWDVLHQWSRKGKGPQVSARRPSAVSEVWSWSPAGGTLAASARAVPSPWVRDFQMDRAWMKRRLLRLISGQGLRRGRLPLTSIIIPCLNNLRHTRECVEFLRRNTQAPYELIIVDNGSTDGTASFVRRNIRAKLVANRRNLGFAKAINQGLRKAKGRYLVWLNNDVLVTPGWLERLIAAVERAPWTGAVGPCTNETVGAQHVESVPYRDTGKGLLLFSQAWALAHHQQALSVPRLAGFCLLVKREAFRQVGFLDERFGLGCYEDFASFNISA